jgi:hypothetical protein
MEGSIAGSGAGSLLVTNGSGCGSGRPKNIRIRIHNTTFSDPILKRKIKLEFILKSFVPSSYYTTSCNVVSSPVCTVYTVVA